MPESLAREPHRFDFFQVLRRLECANPARPRLGRGLRPAEDSIRLGQEPSLSFAPSTLASFEPARSGRPGLLSVFFFGLFGPNGPLPLHLTEYARDRARNFGDHTFARFADLFHHRLLSLFYRAWADAEPTAHFDRPESDRFALYVGALFGLGMPSLRGRDALPDEARLHFAGRLACPARSAEGLADLLRGFFGVAAEVREFVGAWLELPFEDRCRLGESPRTGSLGRNALAGSRIWSAQHRFRVVLGPLGLDDYRRLLPGGASLERLVALVRTYAGDELAWDVQLVLRREEVPPLVLGTDVRLGLTTWLAAQAPPRDPDQLCLDPFAKEASRRSPRRAAAPTETP